MSEAGWTRTTCPYCGVGCGVLARPREDGSAEIKGDPEHPANFGRLCSKGSALGETLSLDDRLLHPIVDGQRTSWDEALNLVASRFSQTIAEHGPDSVALYVSGQILTEDYYAANKLMKGFIGTANIDTNSRLCMASSVAGHKRAFGSDTVPGCYEDLDEAEAVVLVGSNLAWCHPVLYQRLRAASQANGTKVVVIDPRSTATCEIADLHLPIKPGTDVALFNGLLTHLARKGQLDEEFVARSTNGFKDALATAEMTCGEVAAITELPEAQIRQLYDLYCTTQKIVTIYSQGVNQSSAGTDKVNAIINCHLATGRIGKPGASPLSVTGQPNAMGGREVGGLANMLAAHMEIDNAEHRRIVQDFWQSPHIAQRAGLKAVDLFKAVGDGRIKALWIMATNPVDSLPDADRVREAIAGCPFVVVSDVTAATDTAALAHVLLPSAAWGEKDGTVTNSERRISRQRAFLSAPGEAVADWWQIAEVAKRLGHGALFSYQDASEIFAEYAELTGTDNGGTRDLDISPLANLTAAEYAELAPFQWPLTGANAAPRKRMFGDGHFYRPDHRAQFIPTPYRPPQSTVDEHFPLVLNTGRIRDQWHTMTRTGKTSRLMSHIAEPFVEIHPEDAAGRQLEAADLAIIESGAGRALARIAISERQRQGSVFVPMHWNDQFAREARIGAAIFANTDPVSGQPELKHTPVRVSRFETAWQAFAVTLAQPNLSQFDYAAAARAGAGYRIEMAGCTEPDDWTALAHAILDPGNTSIDLLAYHDRANVGYRFAGFSGERCVGLFYAARGPVSVARSWAIEQLESAVPPEHRLRLLAGRPGADAVDRGPIVCACFGVGANEIIGAIKEKGCRSVEEVGTCTNAGTNCGSCRSEIGRLLTSMHLDRAG